MNYFEHDDHIAPRHLSELKAGQHTTHLLPSREQVDADRARLMRELNDPSWNEDIHEARELLDGLTIRKAGTPVHRFNTAIIESDAIMYGAAIVATGTVALCTSAIVGLPFAPVAVASGGVMALAITLIQRLHRMT